jgi:hypothetical protein
MSDLDVLLAVVGLIVTVLVATGMILITPLGTVHPADDTTDSQGSPLGRGDVMRPVGHKAARRPHDRVEP